MKPVTRSARETARPGKARRHPDCGDPGCRGPARIVRETDARLLYVYRVVCRCGRRGRASSSVSGASYMWNTYGPDNTEATT